MQENRFRLRLTITKKKAKLTSLMSRKDNNKREGSDKISSFWKCWLMLKEKFKDFVRGKIIKQESEMGTVLSSFFN